MRDWGDLEMGRKFTSKIVGMAMVGNMLVVTTEKGIYAGRAVNKMRRVKLVLIDPPEMPNESLQDRRQSGGDMSSSGAEQLFLLQVRAEKLPPPETEYRFHDKRRWRLDFAWPDRRLAVEIEGGVYTGGRHVRGDGFEKDAEKYNTAAEMGWTVLRYTPRFVRDGSALEQVKRVLGQ